MKLSDIALADHGSLVTAGSTNSKNSLLDALTELNNVIVGGSYLDEVFESVTLNGVIIESKWTVIKDEQFVGDKYEIVYNSQWRTGQPNADLVFSVIINSETKIVDITIYTVASGLTTVSGKVNAHTASYMTNVVTLIDTVLKGMKLSEIALADHGSLVTSSSTNSKKSLLDALTELYNMIEGES
jgi:hypothetical protein